MPKDYAKRNKPKKKSNSRTSRKKSSNKKPVSPIVWVFTGMLLTFFALFLYALTQKPEYLKDLFSSKTSPQVVSTKQDNSTTSDKQNELPYSYHETLTNKEVKVDDTPAVTAKSNRRYIMQCAATKALDKAEAMKAELAFIGFQSNISEKNGWYRIQLGPYTTKRAAESARHKLQKNDYNDCRIW